MFKRKLRIEYEGAPYHALSPQAILALAGFFPRPASELMVVLGILVYSVAQVAFGASWYALLSPVVPEDRRGRFFGKLRLAWQLMGIAFTVLCALVLSKQTPPLIYQWLLAAVTAGQVVRIFMYKRIPELEPPTATDARLWKALSDVVRLPAYLPFCSYVFLLMLFTAAGPALFVLIEKEVLTFGDNTVMWLSTLAMLGSVAGFYFGGKAVDRRGTKPVFLVCHFAYGLLMALFAFRAIAPAGRLAWVAIVNVCFGFVLAASSVAITTETLALLPRKNKSLAGAFLQSMYIGGGALSTMLVAWIIDLGLLRERWTLAGVTMTQYDSVLLAYAGMIVLLVVTLGQVPSVIRKHEWLPGMR